MKLTHRTAPVFEPEGDRCITLRYGSVLDEQISLQCLTAAAAIEQAGVDGIVDVISSFTTVAVHYRPEMFLPTPYAIVSALLEDILASVAAAQPVMSRTVKVPVCYADEYALDLAYVASACGLTAAQVVDRHISGHVSVFALGFAPGLPYIGVHDKIFDLPRRAEPRASLPGGSVAIANRQTVIYPDTTPGGWHVIGAMPIPLFNPHEPPYAFLLPGDTVEFTPVSLREFDALRQART